MTLILPIAGGTFTPPIYEGRDGAKNWVALIRSHSDAPGGLLREFLPEVDSGKFEAALFRVGEAVEFGAERVEDGPRGGKRSKRTHQRRYGVIRAVCPDRVEIDEYDEAEAALIRTTRAEARAKGQGEPVAALESRRAELLGRRAELAKPMAELAKQMSELDTKIREIEAELALACLLEIEHWRGRRPEAKPE